MALTTLRPQAGQRMFASLSRLLTVTVAGLAVAACVPRATGPIEPNRPVEPVEGPSRLPADETRNRVAVLVPLTGPNAALGQSILNAANLALLDTGGQRIRITAYDTATGAQAAANEALADGSGLILGPLLSEDARIVGPIARRQNVPVIAFSNDVSAAGDNVYVLGLNPAQSVGRVVAYARQQGANRFGAVVPDNPYGQRAGAAYQVAVRDAGGTLVGVQTYDRTATGLRSAATRLLAQGGVDAVLVADGSRTAVQVAPTLRPRGSTTRILGTELWATEGAGAATAALRGAWYAAPSDANYDQFRTRYRARYNAAPFRLASLGYDSVLLTVRIAAGWQLGRTFPARELRDAQGFAGVDGAFRFGRDNIAERALEVREVTGTATSVVAPAPRGF